MFDTGSLPHVFFSSAIYLLFFGIISTNSRTSTHWKLNPDKTKIIEASLYENVDSRASPFLSNEDFLFNIIASTEPFQQEWSKHEVQYFCSNCPNIERANSKNNSDQYKQKKKWDEELSCGKPVNFTYYDNLGGVLNRGNHSNVEEPEAMVDLVKKFQFANGKPLDIETLEKRLMQYKKKKIKSVQVYNQLGNYWRLKGESSMAIECFRKGLAISPHNAEILLNLAKVLFRLQYLDDAIYLTRRSLEVSPPEKGAWQQYYTLGEIFKVYGHYQEAIFHLRHSLELNPGYEPALKILKEIEAIPATTMNVYTMVIIVCLVVGVLLVVASSGNSENVEDLSRCQGKSFNRTASIKAIRNVSLPHKAKKPIGQSCTCFFGK